MLARGFVIVALSLSVAASSDQAQHGHREVFLPDGFVFCSLAYQQNRQEADGTGWKTDYPRAGWNFSNRVTELTTVHREARQGQRVVDVGSPDLFLCPFVFTSDVGTMALTSTEAANLRAYLEKGGLLWVDDFWGWQSWTQWRLVLQAIAPRRSRLVTPGPDHPIFHVFVRITAVPQLGHIGYWKRGVSAERGEDSPPTPLQILETGDGHVAVVMTHNTDIGDTWEQEHDRAFFEATAGEGYGLGLNVLLHAMTH